MAWCERCGNAYDDKARFCAECGNALTDRDSDELVYWFDWQGNKRVVFCPRCGNPRCSIYTTSLANPTYITMIPAKVKTRYTLDLNPFHPFTLFKEKTKIKRAEQVIIRGGEKIIVQRYICDSCGEVF